MECSGLRQAIFTCHDSDRVPLLLSKRRGNKGAECLNRIGDCVCGNGLQLIYSPSILILITSFKGHYQCPW